ncbi:MAG: signal peptidase II [Spirochaetaceae bacterium]|jgi:signal peptidase II|nr:signal peptidase II [Spirochaetaceae bacterium]
MSIKRLSSFVPLSLAAGIIILDQITKAIVVSKIPLGTYVSDPDKFFQIVHLRNKVIAFSLGDSLPDAVKPVLFVVVPLAIVVFLCWYFFTSQDLSKFQRWVLSGIIGGGIGNIIDRIFRPDGVVDFISIRFYGIFGMERWPTFNIADSAVVSCVLLFLVSIFLPSKKAQEIDKGKTE